MPDESAAALHRIFHKIWTREEVPADWKHGIIIKLAKKGDLGICDNWRGITLLEIVSKVFTRCILARIQDVIDRKLRREQAGFRKGRSCLDQIFALRNLIEQCDEFQRPLFLNFIDFEKAFDSVHRGSMWRLLRHYGVPEKIVEIIKLLYEDFSCSVMHEGNQSPWFKFLSGQKQGCLLSPLLFLVAIDWIMRQATEGKCTGIEWMNGEELEDLDYADDLALITDDIDKMKIKTKRVGRAAKKIGLKISTKKTKTLRIHTEENDKIYWNGDELEDVDSFVYLGAVLDKHGGSDADMSARIFKAQGVFKNLGKVWNSRYISRQTKMKILNASVKSVLFYGVEAWKMGKRMEQRLRVFHHKCLRRILRVFWPNIVSNQELLRRTGEEDIVLQAKK